MHGRKGFSLVEGMVVLVLMALIMSSVYLMIMYFRDVSGTEQARVRQSQESRYLLSVFSSELKNSGSVLTLVNTGGFLSAIPNFNGIYPLNNTGFPDGIILSDADPMAVTKLTAEFNPSTGGVNLPVEKTVATPAWDVNDQGIIAGPDGFYVFSVAAKPADGATVITMRNTAVYYSGLLDTDSSRYKDASALQGNNVAYPANAPVIRVADFSIYLVHEHDDAAKGRNVRDLVRVSDCKGVPDVLNFTSSDPDKLPLKGVIAENVWDLQLTYTVYPDFAGDPTNKVTYFNGGSGTLADLLTAIRAKTLKEITVSVVALTDDYPGQGEITYQLPAIADHPANSSLPAGKFNYKIYSFLIEPRNFNIRI